MINRLQHDRVLGDRSGSFWVDTVTENSRDLVKRVSRLASRHGLFAKHTSAQANLGGAQYVPVENFTVEFDPRSVVIDGPDLQARIRVVLGSEPGKVFYRRPTLAELYSSPQIALSFPDEFGEDLYLSLDGTDLLVGPDPEASGASFNTWIVPFPFTLEAFSLQSTKGLLVRGQEYEQSGGFLRTFVPPQDLWPDFKIHVAHGAEPAASLLGFTLKVDGALNPMHEVVKYRRTSQSIAQLKRAAAAASGFVVLPATSKLVRRQSAGGITRYQFEDYVRYVSYSHEVLEEGQLYPEGTIIGADFDLAGPDGRPFWYRDFSFSNGLDLAPLTAIPGIRILDMDSTAEIVSNPLPPQNGKRYCRFPVNGDSDKVAKFWRRVDRNSAVSGFFLADYIGINAGTPSKIVNPLDLVFQGMLRDRAIILRLGRAPAATAERLRRFIMEEKPAGSILVELTT